MCAGGNLFLQEVKETHFGRGLSLAKCPALVAASDAGTKKKRPARRAASNVDAVGEKDDIAVGDQPTDLDSNLHATEDSDA